MILSHLIRVASIIFVFFFFQAEDGIRDLTVTGVQTCALPILGRSDGEGAVVKPLWISFGQLRTIRLLAGTTRAQQPRPGTGMPKRRQRLASPTSDMPKSLARSRIGFDQTSS